MKGESTIELSPSSSFDLTNSFCTSFKYQLISRNCVLRELVKSQEKVYGSIRLGVEVLEASVDRSAIAPRGLEGNSGGSCKLLMSSCRGPRALLVEQGGPAVLLGRFVARVPLVVPIEGWGRFYTCGLRDHRTEIINADGGTLDRPGGMLPCKVLPTLADTVSGRRRCARCRHDRGDRPLGAGVCEMA
ncbi:hypothetical protein B296_00017929 [Ensete ventricosum]|uniref:Uncharacterized protein n=1 Tax=Ensete ventricosum TaxID=4639 RepID=A0A426ZMZ2_ENSVE|nr:hypothetical protein B296_00017929 [Ensete ventricosum]